MLDRVERHGAAGLTAKAYRERVLADLREVLPYDGHVWLLTDPVTRVGTSPYADVPGLAFEDLPHLGRLRYLTTVNRWDVLLDEGRQAATLLATTEGDPTRSRLWRECLSGLRCHRRRVARLRRPVRLLGVAGPVAHGRAGVRARRRRVPGRARAAARRWGCARRRPGRSSTTPRRSTCPGRPSSCSVPT